MWCLELVGGDVTYMLIPGKVYTVGRKAGDIVLANDQSVSRKHASLQVKTPITDGVIVWDDSSKFGTFLVEGDTSYSKLDAGTKVSLKDGGKVRFGLQNNIFTLKRPCVCVSNLKTADLNRIKQTMTEVNGKLVEKWIDNATHLTTSSLSLTHDVICALASAKPIITPAFWYCSKQIGVGSESIFDPAKFTPPLEDKKLMLKENLSLPNSARKTLFKDKTFVFSSPQSFQKFKDIIRLAGGQALKLSKCKLSLKELCEPNVVVVACAENEQTSAYKDVTRFFNEQKHRIILEEDIGLAIWKVSTAVHCNTTFTPESALGKSTTPFQDGGRTLVVNTEDETTLTTENEFTNKVIPPTFPNTNTSTGDETCSLNLKSENPGPSVPAGGSSRKRNREWGDTDNFDDSTIERPSHSTSVKQEPVSHEDEDLFAGEDTKATDQSSIIMNFGEESLISVREERKSSKRAEADDDGFFLPSPKKKRTSRSVKKENNDEFELPMKPPSPKAVQRKDDEDGFGFLNDNMASSSSRKSRKMANCDTQNVSRDLFEPTQESNISLYPSTSNGKRKIGHDSEPENHPAKRAHKASSDVTKINNESVKPKSCIPFIDSKIIPKIKKEELLNNEEDELALSLHTKVVVTALIKSSKNQRKTDSPLANSNDSTLKNFKKFRKSWSGTSQRHCITVAPVHGEGLVGNDSAEDEQAEDDPHARRPASRRNRMNVVDDDDDEFALPTFSQVG